MIILAFLPISLMYLKYGQIVPEQGHSVGAVLDSGTYPDFESSSNFLSQEWIFSVIHIEMCLKIWIH